MRKISYVLLTVMLMASQYAFATISLPQLASLLKTKQDNAVNYTQRRYLDFADNAIVTQGQLVYIPPNILIQMQKSPRAIDYIANGDNFRIKEHGKTQHQANINDYPMLQATIGSLRFLMQGDVKGLQKWYAVKTSGTKKQWQVQLTPQTQALAKAIAKITVNGSMQALTYFSVKQKNGNRIDIEITS